jgi:hypothetical protein
MGQNAALNSAAESTLRLSLRHSAAKILESLTIVAII